MKFWDLYIKTLIAEILAVLIILISVGAVRLCFKNTYNKLQAWYNENVLSDTNVNEVLKGEI